MIQSKIAQRSWILLSGLLLAVIMVALPGITLAQEPSGVKPFIVTLPPNATVEVLVNGYCMNRGLPFPGVSMLPVGLSPDEVRVAIAYIVEKDYIKTNLYPSQLAIWNLTDGKRPANVDHTLADEIVKYAKSGVKPSDVGVTTMSLSEAISKSLVSATVEGYENIAPPPYFYFGKGNLVIKNLTDKAQTIHIPYGITFKDASKTGVQDMGIFPSPSKDTVCSPMKVVLPKGGSAKVKVDGYCLDRKTAFPSAATIASVSLAPDKVRATICHNVQQGYLKDNLYESQLAVWNAVDGQAAEGKHEVADKIVAFVGTGVKPADVGTTGTALPDAVTKKLVSATINDFKNAAADPSCYGQGTLEIANLSEAEQAVYIPYGTIFNDPSKPDGQKMGIFPSDGSVIAPTPTPAPVVAAAAVTKTAVVSGATLPAELPRSGGDTPLDLLKVVGFMGAGLALLIAGYAMRQKLVW